MKAGSHRNHRLNDLLSFRKEMVFGALQPPDMLTPLTAAQPTSLHSLVPIMLREGDGNLNEVVQILVDSLQVSKDNLERAAGQLLDMVADHTTAKSLVAKYVECFRTNIAGNYWWS